MPPKDDDLAVLILETVPMMMGDIRDRMRTATSDKDLTFPQFRVLGYVSRHEGVSLSGLADALGLTMPQASKLVQALVERDLVAREPSPDDRRQVSLRLGATAKARWKQMREIARASLAERLAPLTRDEREQLVAGLRALRRALSSG